ncbi:MAG: tyrosine-protein phosphatase [Planctomycetes bacterium]|nr:tyrosine-protein phosphatase [Planctomycetota bacterium]
MNVPRFIRRLFRAPFDGMRHYGVVHAGVLYRCGQPTPDQLGELIDRHALRTVVSLRGVRTVADPDAWEQAERGVCQGRNVEFVSLPCNHKNPPTAEQVEQFLDLMREPGRHPVLVHCRLGQQRTLLFCALFRVRIQGVAAEQALREMDQLGFGSHKRRHRKLLQAFHGFARRPDQTGPTG